MYNNVFISFTIAVILTIVVELFIAYLLKFRGRDEYRVIMYMNIITNLLMNFVLIVIARMFWDSGYYILLVVFEVIVVYAEFRILLYVFRKDYSSNKLLFSAICMNVASVSSGGLGMFLFRRMLLY